MLAQAKRFETGAIYADLDIHRLSHERRRMNTYQGENLREHLILPVHMEEEETLLERRFSARPFVPDQAQEREKRCDEILSIQSFGLKNAMSTPDVSRRCWAFPAVWILPLRFW